MITSYKYQTRAPKKSDRFFLQVCWTLNPKFLNITMNGPKNHPLMPTCQHISSQPFMSLLGRKIIFKQAAFLPIDPHGAAPPVNFFLLKKGWCRPQLSSWVQCQLRLCQWCPVETYCRHTGACIGFGRTFRNEAFRYTSVLQIRVFLHFWFKPKLVWFKPV